MSRLSIPRRYPNPPGPPGERQADCDYCGIKYYRSEMRRDAAGFLACLDTCAEGRDAVTLDRANAEAAARASRPRPGWRD